MLLARFKGFDGRACLPMVCEDDLGPLLLRLLTISQELDAKALQCLETEVWLGAK